VSIDNHYDVSEWNGEKYIVLSTANNFGGKSYFQAVFYMGAGVVCLLCAFIYILRDSLGSKVDYTDPYNLKWD
jgi:hypothetical protein